ncbi:MAG: hypothetical protein NT062_07615 [Proteobacteria bacterium]|nr:hypothetical protein [Pseudomonadota bacterium]
MRRLAIITILLCLGITRPARADLASSLYGDIHDVVQELIETEVTTSVVAKLKARSPALGFYMHGTLERLASPYWGSLGRTLKADLTVMIADFVYWHMSVGGGDGDIVKSAQRFFNCSNGGPDQLKPACQRLLAAVVGQNRPLLEVECRRVKPDADRRMACDVALATLAALEGRKEVRHHLTDALTDVVLQEIGNDRGLTERAQDVLSRWLELKNDIPVPLFEVLGNADVGDLLDDAEIEKRCGADNAWRTMADFFNDPTVGPAWVCFAVTAPALKKALEIGVTIREKDATPKVLRDTLSAGYLNAHFDYWKVETAIKDLDFERATEDVVARAILDMAMDEKCPQQGTPADPSPSPSPDVAAPLPCQGVRLAPGAAINIYFLNRNYVGTVSATGQIELKPAATKLSALMAKYNKGMKRIRELRALVPAPLKKYVFFAGEALPNANKMLRAVHQMVRLVTELRSRWYLWQSDAKQAFEELDVAELLRVARASLGKRADKIEVLAFLDKHAIGGASSIDIGDWFRYVMRADFRALAMESLRAALDLKLGDSSRPAETFFMTLASYLLDAGDGVGEEVARSAFKASAKELLLQSATRGVPRSGDRVRLSYLPRVALKFAFNDAYADTDNDTKRTVVSADWPTAMIAITDYIGVEGSIADLVAPLSEMALRPPGQYDKQGLVLLDLVRPRVGMWVAMPALSRRVALTIGAGARFLDATRTDDRQPSTPLQARYRAHTSFAFDAGIQFIF